MMLLDDDDEGCRGLRATIWTRTKKSDVFECCFFSNLLYVKGQATAIFFEFPCQLAYGREAELSDMTACGLQYLSSASCVNACMAGKRSYQT